MKRLLLVAMAVIPFLISCPTENPFADIEGVNLLSEDEQAFTGWAVDYGYDDVTFEYMTFTESSQAGPDTGDTVRRVEIVNLVPNGDFESALSGWAIVDGATRNAISSTLVYDLSDDTDRVDYDLSNAAADGLVTTASYIVRFDFKSDAPGSSYFEYRSPANTWQLSINDASPVYNFPTDFTATSDATFTPDAATNIFSIGALDGGGAMSGYIDNFRVARTDITSCITLDVPVSSTGRSDLPSGTYRLTVYVKNDPDVTPITANRMPAAAVCLAIESAEDASVSGFAATVYQTSAAWSEWTACSVTGFIQVDGDAETALRLRISPTDTLSGSYGRDVGSLLVSSPVLEYSANGSF